MDGIENSSRDTVAASELGALTRDERPRNRDAGSLLCRRHVSKSHASREEGESRNSFSFRHLVWSRYSRESRPGPSSISPRNWGVPIAKEVLSHSSPASRAALRTRRDTEGTTRASARTGGRYASRRHQCRGRGPCAGHSGLGNDGRSMSTEQFFSASKDDDAGEAVAEDTLEARGGDEARQREQGTQRPGRPHPWRLTQPPPSWRNFARCHSGDVPAFVEIEVAAAPWPA